MQSAGEGQEGEVPYEGGRKRWRGLVRSLRGSLQILRMRSQGGWRKRRMKKRKILRKKQEKPVDSGAGFQGTPASSEILFEEA